MQKEYGNDMNYRAVKEYIIFGELIPGETISEAKVQKDLGLTRTAVRDIFVLLEMENLIISRFRKGYHVSHVSPKRLQEIYEVRQVMEPAALEKGMQNIDRKWLMEIRTRFMNCHSSQSDSKELILLDNEFHNTLISSVGNRYASALLSCALDYLALLRVHMLRGNAKYHLRIRDHTDIIDAILCGNREKSAALMSDHIQSSYHQFLRSMIRFL